MSDEQILEALISLYKEHKMCEEDECYVGEDFMQLMKEAIDG